MRTATCIGIVLAGLVLLGCQGGANSSNRANSPNGSNGTNSKNNTPSCLPPGYQSRLPGKAGGLKKKELPGQELDIKLAVVEGEVITRRRMVRESGPRAPGQSEGAYERALHQRLKRRVRLLIFAREARRNGIQIPPQRLDEVVAGDLRDKVREAEKTTGQPVTREQYLSERNLTYDEYRDRIREELLYKAYMLRVFQGLGAGGRPQVDMSVSPAEIRRIYWSYPGAFDEKPGVRFVVWQFPVERYLSDDVGFLDAEEKARQEGQQLLEGFRAGQDPEDLARRFDLGEGEWRDSGDFAERERLEQMVGTEAATWLFDPSRRPGDVTILEESIGPIVLAVREIRAASRIPYEDAYDKIRNMYALVRQRRREEERVIEILSTRNVVQPPRLHDELLVDAQMVLEELNRDPILGAARFR